MSRYTLSLTVLVTTPENKIYGHTDMWSEHLFRKCRDPSPREQGPIIISSFQTPTLFQTQVQHHTY